MANESALTFAVATALISARTSGWLLPLEGADATRARPAEPAASPGPGDPEEIIELLRTTAAALGRVIAALSDEQLAEADPETLPGGQPATIQALIEIGVLEPLRETSRRIDAAIRSAPRTPGGIGTI